MSTVNSAYSSSSRISGIYSGMDTDELVEAMTSTQQAKIDKQEQKKTRYNGIMKL
jgi:flagellar hook-associated protein 2